MTQREKVLVWAMGGAVAWVGATLGLDAARGGLGSARHRQETLAIQAFAEAQRAKIAPLRLKPKEKFALDRAAAEWAESPFIEWAADTKPLGGHAQKYHYTGFIQAGDQRLAIVNGREYRVAEPVGTGDFRVEAIEPDHVVLISKSGGRRMTIALQNSSENKRKSP